MILPLTNITALCLSAVLLLGCQPTLNKDQENLSVATQKGISQLLWESDLGDGNYQNPILHIDYSDPDVVRVGGDYYMTASSFNAAPGLPILHSTDLVNWQLINYALPQQVPLEVFEIPQHGNGVWAPNICFHDDKFWIFYPDPDFGIYVVTSSDPAKEWSKPKLILAGKGLIDPTPLWDDDGQAWLLHAWAKSRAGFNNVLSLRKMAEDVSWVSEQYEHIVEGHKLPGYRTIEGPKFYKRNGYYYIFAPAGGVETGWQTVFRAQNIHGPYEAKIVMAQESSLINGPHQGSWIHTEKNEDWFIHFQSRKAYGRIVHLQPVKWVNDWPVIGHDTDGDGVGQPVYTHLKPATDKAGMIKRQPTSDEFDLDKLGIQWQWNANYKQDWYSLTQSSGKLRLYGQSKINSTGDNLWMTPSLLLQKNPALTYEVVTKVDLANSSVQAEGGLLVFGENYAWIGIKPIDGKPHLVYVSCTGARKGCNESVHDYGPIEAPVLELRYIMNADATVVFSYRTDSKGRYTVIGEQFNAVRGRWVGAKVGLFSVSSMPNSQAYLDVDYIRFLPLLRH